MIITTLNNIFSLSARQKVLQSQSGTNLHLDFVSLILNGNKGYVCRCKLYLKWTVTRYENCSPRGKHTLCNTKLLWAFNKKRINYRIQGQNPGTFVYWAARLARQRDKERGIICMTFSLGFMYHGWHIKQLVWLCSHVEWIKERGIIFMTLSLGLTYLAARLAR